VVSVADPYGRNLDFLDQTVSFLKEDPSRSALRKGVGHVARMVDMKNVIVRIPSHKPLKLVNCLQDLYHCS
jgi:hypothetical protein